MPRGASCKSISLALSYLWKAGEASLSSLVYYGLRPQVVRCSWRSLKTQMNSISDLVFMGRINIILLSYSCNKLDTCFPYWRLQGICGVVSGVVAFLRALWS